MRILFCSDGSAAAEEAVRFAAPIAAGCHAETTILGISEAAGPKDALLPSLRRSQELLQQQSVSAELVTKSGPSVPEIVQRTREILYDLVVIGTERRRRGASFRRSVKTHQIIEAITPPVLLYLGERRALRNILLCTGGGEPAGKAVELTGTIARSTQAAVTLFHVLAAAPVLYSGLLNQEEDASQVLRSDSALGRGLRQRQESLEKLGVACTVRLRHGVLVPELLTELRQAEYDLVVAGSSPVRDPVRAYMLGNVTREVINHAEWPVLIVRSGPLPHRWSKLVTGLFSGAQRPSDTTVQ
jgi:nucleotide-binding universal stress UspA family protein